MSNITFYKINSNLIKGVKVAGFT